MGQRNPERWSRETWRLKAETAGKMREQGWRVRADCEHCRKSTPVDLDRVILLKGRDYSLWNRQRPCEVLRCPGTVRLYARAPNTGAWLVLEAQDPGYSPAFPPGQR